MCLDTCVFVRSRWFLCWCLHVSWCQDTSSVHHQINGQDTSSVHHQINPPKKILPEKKEVFPGGVHIPSFTPSVTLARHIRPRRTNVWHDESQVNVGAPPHPDPVQVSGWVLNRFVVYEVIVDKVRSRGGRDVKRCRFGETQRDNPGGSWRLNHTRWIGERGY